MRSHPETIFNNTREAILFNAYQAFSKKGYLNTTTKDIAKASNINESTLFRQFESKEKLFHSVLQNFGFVSLKDITSVDYLLTYQSIELDLEVLFSFYYQQTYEHIDLLRILYINSPFVAGLENFFYILPTIRLHFSSYLYRYYLQKSVSAEQIEFLIDFFLNHISRFISDLYGHDYLYQLDDNSQPLIDQEIKIQINVFKAIDLKITACSL